MSIGSLQTEADLKRFVERLLATPGVLPPSTEPKRETGTATATFSEAADSNEVTVAHHLGVVPAHVSISLITFAGPTLISYRITERTAEHFKFQLNAEGTLAGALEVTWEART